MSKVIQVTSYMQGLTPVLVAIDDAGVMYERIGGEATWQQVEGPLDAVTPLDDMAEPMPVAPDLYERDEAGRFK